MRNQQLFDASQFSNFRSGGFITQIIFRPDASFGFAFSSTLADMQINLSTTSVPDDGLSLVLPTTLGLTRPWSLAVLSLSPAISPAGSRRISIL